MYSSIFPNGEITEGWNEVLMLADQSNVYPFEKDGELFGLVVITEHEGNAYIINSIAKDNQQYTFAMQRMILKWTRLHSKVMIMSTLEDSCIKRFTDRFVSNGEQSCFVKGL